MHIHTCFLDIHVSSDSICSYSKIALCLIDIHLVAAIKAAENYDNLSTGFKDVFVDINNLIADPVISILEEDYEVVFYLCSDYKVNFHLWL